MLQHRQKRCMNKFYCEAKKIFCLVYQKYLKMSSCKGTIGCDTLHRRFLLLHIGTHTNLFLFLLIQLYPLHDINVWEKIKRNFAFVPIFHSSILRFDISQLPNVKFSETYQQTMSVKRQIQYRIIEILKETPLNDFFLLNRCS